MNKFIAALDQSGSSINRTLSLYGAKYNEDNKKQLIDEFKMRIIRSKCFNSDIILGVIISKDMLNEDTLNYLDGKNLKVFVKIDTGLEQESNGVRLFKDIDLDGLKGAYGTKMRSLILKDDEKGISDAINQQFEMAKKIYSRGFIPIIEPEVSIEAENKMKCEKILKKELMKYMDSDIKFILKLTLPEIDDYYSDLIKNENLLYLSFLSGGYSKEKSIKKLKNNRGIACFSRVLLEGLKYSQNDEEFEYTLNKNIDDIERNMYERDKD